MKIKYVNQQDKFDIMNGEVIADEASLVDLLNRRRSNAPFFGRFSGDNGFELMIGMGGEIGCVQHSRTDGDPPYLVAVAPQPRLASGYVEFLTANTPTPVPARNILTFDELKKIALYFLETGERCDAFSWDSI
jgi:hypothetical protein